MGIYNFQPILWIKIWDIYFYNRTVHSAFVKVLGYMGAEISIENLRPQFGEQVGDIKVEKSHLSSIDINKEDIPSIIDELPIFALVASQAEGITTVNGVGELRLKESDRLEAMRELFSSIGMKLEIYEESFKIIGFRQPTNIKQPDGPPEGIPSARCQRVET